MEKDGLNIIKLESSHQILDSNKHVGESLETTASWIHARPGRAKKLGKGESVRERDEDFFNSFIEM